MKVQELIDILAAFLRKRGDIEVGIASGDTGLMGKGRCTLLPIKGIVTRKFEFPDNPSNDTTMVLIVVGELTKGTNTMAAEQGQQRTQLSTEEVSNIYNLLKRGNSYMEISKQTGTAAPVVKILCQIGPEAGLAMITGEETDEGLLDLPLLLTNKLVRQMEDLGRFGIVIWYDADIAEALEERDKVPTQQNIAKVLDHPAVRHIRDAMTEVGWAQLALAIDDLSDEL